MSGTRPGGPVVLVIQHEAGAPAALVGEWLAEKGIRLDVCRAYAGDTVPASSASHDGLLVLGGGMGAGDDDVAPWLPDVRSLLREAVAAGSPTWGICLGGQLLAMATGGSVGRGDVPELGVLPVVTTPSAAMDPLAGTLPAGAVVAQFHRDGITDLPPGAVLLATSDAYPHQAFRVGDRAWGVQFHPEVDADVVEPWLTDEPDLAQASGRTDAEVLDELRQHDVELRATWRPFTRAWADVVLASRGSSAESGSGGEPT